MNKVICMYLPQFHEFQENNEWWGQGFTEWTCLKKAKKLTDGHVIKYPHPDLGYYNLLDKKTRKKQSDIAKKFGVYGFCYYHYWFYNKVLMQKPLELMLTDNQPDIPFMLSWANEPWTRRMNGGDGQTIQNQFYGNQDEWDRHLDYLLPFFMHKNYIKIQNKPVFCIYRISQITNFVYRFQYWKEKIKNYGFDGLHIVMTLGVWPKEEAYPILPFVDAVFDFYPNFLKDPKTIKYEKNNIIFCDIEKAYSIMITDPQIHKNHYRGLMVGFDNSPRSPKKSCVFINNSPILFQKALRQQLQQSNQEFIFLNAWNEWGEQACLEPDSFYGYEYLECFQKALRTIKHA